MSLCAVSAVTFGPQSGPPTASQSWPCSTRVPNALCWSPDDATMYFADTRDGRLRAYAWDRDSGAPGAMRVLVDDGVLPGAPDGAIVDADGCVWNARYAGGGPFERRLGGFLQRGVHKLTPGFRIRLS